MGRFGQQRSLGAVAMVAATTLIFSGIAAAGEPAAGQAAAGKASSKPSAKAKPKRTPPESARSTAPKAKTLTQYTAASRATQQADGKTRLEVYAQPKFQRTATGWKELSGKLTEHQGEVAVRADEAARPVWFGSSASKLLQIRLPQGTPVISLPGAKIGRPQVKQTKVNHFVTYPSVAKDTDLVYDVHGSEVKEKFILKSKDAPRSFTFHLSDPKRLLGKPTETAFEGYSFSNEIADGIRLQLASPQAWEQKRPAALPGSAHQKVTPRGDGYDITLSVDEKWLAGKAYPIVLDPSLQYTFDQGTLASAFAPIGATACSGNPCQLSSTTYGDYLLGNDPTYGPIRAYFQVDLSNIPADTMITSSTFGQGLAYAYIAKEELHATTRLMTPTDTGADLAAATDPQILGTYGKDGVSWSSDYAPTTIDITKKVRAWVQSSTGGGLTLKLADENAPVDPYLTTSFTAPSVTIDYMGATLPPPIPVWQTYGCDCRWVHGAGVSGRRIDPINTAAGAPTETHTDLPVEHAPGISLGFNRTFNGGDDTVGPLGTGWTHAFDSSLTEDAITGNVTFRDPTGGRSRYLKQLDGSYLGDPGITATLESRTAGGWTLTSLAGETLTFDAAGKPLTDLDKDGKGLTYTYSSGRLATATDSLGRVLTFGYGTTGAANGRLTTVTANDGRQVAYQYTSVGGDPYLTGVTAADGTDSTIAYDSTGRLTGITDDNGHTSAGNEYDPVTGRVTEQTDASGATWHLSWNDSTQTETITDPRGGVTKDTYYGNVLIKHVAADGGETSYFYDGNLNQTGVLDPRGNLTHMTYDTAGNMLTRTASAPFNYQESWTYDTENRPLTHMDPLFRQTSFTYDGGQLATVTDPDGTTTYAYTSDRQLESVTNRLGKATSYSYNTAGDLVSVTDPDGHKTTMAYDTAHRRISLTDPNGNVTGCSCAAAHTQTWTYDDAGRVLTSTDALSRTKTYTYDGAANVLTETDAAGTTTNTYTATNLIKTGTNADGKTTTFSYDDTGNLLSVVDPLGRKTTHTYDPVGRMKTSTAPLGNATGASTATKAAYTTTYGYDENGNQTSVSVPDPDNPSTNLVTATTYDALNRPVTTTDPTGAATTNTYDRGSRVTDVTNPLGAISHTNYDRGDRPNYVVDPTGKYQSTAYDAEGRATQVSDGGSTTIYTYDDAGRLTGQGDKRSVYCYCDDYTTKFSYDASGQLTSTEDPLGHTTATAYNPAGQRTLETDANGNDTTYTYDSAGRLRTVTDPEGGVTTYAYDSLGQVTDRTDPRGHHTTYDYDEAGQLLTATSPEGREWEYAYDLNGRRTTATLPSGTGTTTPGDGTISTTYDTLGRVTDLDYSDSTPSPAWTYDKASRPTTLTDGLSATQGPIEYTYDAAGQLLTRSRGSDTYAYTYDLAGRITNRTYPNGTEVHASYSAGGRQTSLTWGDNGIYYGYNTAGDRYRADTSNGTYTTYTFDDARRRIGSLTSSTSGDIEYSQTLDPRGNPTSITTTRGTTATTSTYAYDLNARLTSVCFTAPCTSTTGQGITYDYDANSNRTQSVRTGIADPGTTNYTYNNDDQPTAATDATSTPIGAFTHNSNGQLTGDTTGAGRSFDYNLAGQLTSATLGSTTTSYLYDGEGNRAQATTGSTPTTYSYDTNNPNPLLTTQATAGGTTLNFANDGTGALTANDGTDTAWYFHDLQGNIADLYDASGTTLGSYAYEPFGTPLNSPTGAGIPTSNPFQFAGEQADGGSGLTNLRARNYDPALGRFTSLDPMPPGVGQPFTSSYAYVYNNPLTASDPSGMCIECWFSPQAAVLNGQGVEMYRQATSWFNQAKKTGTQLGVEYVQNPNKATATAVYGAGRSIPDGIVALGTLNRNPYVDGQTVYDCYDRWMDDRERQLGLDPDSPWNPVGAAGLDAALMLTGVGEIRAGLRLAAIAAEIEATRKAEEAAAAAARLAAYRAARAADELALAQGWRATSFGDEAASLNYHYTKHGLKAGVSKEQYAQDARAWARKPAGTGKSVQLKDGTQGLTYRTPGGGPGGIVDLDGKIITFWYR